MKIIDKIKNWYRGQYIPPTLTELFDQPTPKDGHFNPSFVAKILNSIIRFWLAHWQWIIGTSVAIIIGGLTAYFTYLQAIKK